MKSGAVISVFDKENIEKIAEFLLNKNFKLYLSDGSYKFLNNLPVYKNQDINTISSLTEFPEILEGRVKTLHPKIYGGILANRSKPTHLEDINTHAIPKIDIVICNLYPFQMLAKEHELDEILIENIDIGGVSLIRAAAKNFKDVTIITNPNDYQNLINNWESQTIESRQNYAKKAFQYITQYDLAISQKFGNNNIHEYTPEIPLKYGCNPHQKSANICSINNKSLPFTILNGNIGYINTLDALNAWQLVSELASNNLSLYSTPIVAAASFKHTSPAGVALSIPPIPNDQKALYLISDTTQIGNTATAFLKARYADPKSSFGDFIAISSKIDKETAEYIKKEVSDGIIALGYTEEALEILKQKKGGKYIILQANRFYTSQEAKIEYREMFGLALSQTNNIYTPSINCLKNIVTNQKDISVQNKLDLILANTTLKYTQSNSIAIAVNGQTIGVGAGQQNRVDCVKLAGQKARTWYQRQNPEIKNLLSDFKENIKRQEKINAIMQYIENDYMEEEFEEWNKLFSTPKEKFSATTYPNTNENNLEFCLASDAFFPFADNIRFANKYNCKHIIQPGGSMADEEVINACNKYNISMIFTGNRLFTH